MQFVILTKLQNHPDFPKLKVIYYAKISTYFCLQNKPTHVNPEINKSQVLPQILTDPHEHQLQRLSYACAIHPPSVHLTARAWARCWISSRNSSRRCGSHRGTRSPGPRFPVPFCGWFPADSRVSSHSRCNKSENFKTAS